LGTLIDPTRERGSEKEMMRHKRQNVMDSHDADNDDDHVQKKEEDLPRQKTKHPAPIPVPLATRDHPPPLGAHRLSAAPSTNSRRHNTNTTNVIELAVSEPSKSLKYL
jgi:hypothetical protein